MSQTTVKLKMELRKVEERLVSIVLLICLFDEVYTYVGPNHGFFVAIQNPATGRSSDDVYVYALHTNSLQAGDAIQVCNDDTSVYERGERIRSETLTWGSYLSFARRKRQRALRYGSYRAEYNADAGSSNSDASSYGFVRPRSALLDTNGVYTVTIYPATSSGTTLSSAFDNSIKLSSRSWRFKLQWFKDNKRVQNTSNRLKLKTTEDAGLYTIRRQGRGDRQGAEVQIRVIASTCPYNEYWNGAACVARTTTCKNGGVPKNTEDDCTCMPLFADDSDQCNIQVDSVGEKGIFVLGISGDKHIQCHNLPGANFKCRGMLFCYGDLYGCKCANGWRGDNCDKPCRKGTWGAGCSLDCPDTNSDCGRFVGPNQPASIK